MLALFDRTVKPPPEGLRSPDDSVPTSAASVAEHFTAIHDGAVSISLGTSGSMAYTSEGQNPLHPRLFAVVDDIFCLFQGHIENIAHLKLQCGLNKTADEVIIVIEAYRSLRDRGPYPAKQVVRDLNGKFAFILFDSSSKSAFVATITKVLETKLNLSISKEDSDGSVPFFWGTDSEECVLFSDDAEIVKKGCGKSFAPFPKGCFFTTSRGLSVRTSIKGVEAYAKG